MGDRALVQFEDSTGRTSPVIYLHWSGEEASAWLRELAILMTGRPNDASYAAARFAGICHRHINGNMSLGMWNQEKRLTAEDSHGDAGCFVVNCHTWQVEAMGGYGESFNAAANEATERRWTTNAGLEAEVRLCEQGYRCGYVRVPVGHKWHGKDYDEIGLGGHTNYSDRLGTADEWWFGFSCDRFIDRLDMVATIDRYGRAPAVDSHPCSDTATVKTLAYCVAECEQMAAALAEVK